MERLIKILEGRGVFTADSGEAGPTDYDISVTKSGAKQSVHGKVAGDAFLLFSALDSGGAKLRTQEGIVLDVALTTVDDATSSADVVVKGEFPDGSVGRSTREAKIKHA